MYKFILLLSSLCLLSSTVLATDDKAIHANDVLQKTQGIIPYAVDKTRMSFTKTVHGGIQHILAKSPGDLEQVKLIQAYMQKMASDFSKGDFSATETIHGADMPGLAKVKTAQSGDIKYEYQALEDGAQIHFSTEFPEYVQALHEWFNAQIKDHGNDDFNEHNQHHSKTITE